MTGVPRDMLVPRDFIMLHLDLVDMLPSLEAAILLLRIQYRTGSEGEWWTVTKAEMQEETRLSERKLDRALRELLDAGFIEWVRASATDSTRKVRVVYTPDPTGRNVPNPVRDETSRTPSSKKYKNSPSTKVEDEVQSTESRHHEEQFDKWWNDYPKKVGKAAARKAYLKAVKTTSPECIQAGLTAQLPFLQARKAEGYCPDPASWLNAGRWDDEVTPLRHSKQGGTGADYSHLPWHQRRERQPGESHDQWQQRVFG